MTGLNPFAVMFEHFYPYALIISFPYFIGIEVNVLIGLPTFKLILLLEPCNLEPEIRYSFMAALSF